MFVLRLVHVLSGIFWAGTLFFIVIYLEPSVRAAGPDGAKVMQGIQKRGLLNVLPIVALLTILTGVDMYRRLSGGFQPSWVHSPIGTTYGIGAITAIVAFTIGVFVMRAATLKAGSLAASLGSMTDASERANAEARVQMLRVRARITARWVAALLAVTVITMAIGRYV